MIKESTDVIIKPSRSLLCVTEPFLLLQDAAEARFRASMVRVCPAGETQHLEAHQGGRRALSAAESNYTLSLLTIQCCPVRLGRSQLRFEFWLGIPSSNLDIFQSLSKLFGIFKHFRPLGQSSSAGRSSGSVCGAVVSPLWCCYLVWTSSSLSQLGSG